MPNKIPFQVDAKVLKKYADVFIKFALNKGKGIKSGETVLLQVPESARPMLEPLQRSVLEAGGYPLCRLIPEGLSKSFFELASEDQIQYNPKKMLMAKVEEVDHFVSIISDFDPLELSNVDSKKIMQRSKAGKFYKEALFKKWDSGKGSWTLGMYATKAMAEQAGISVEEYWDQISEACFLKEEDPIAKWKEVYQEIDKILDYLNSLDMRWVNIKGEDCDLNIYIGENRKWLGGSGHNIPSFECFVSPDWRKTNGWIKFDQPLLRYGSRIEGIELEFKDGLVVSSKASMNEELLKEMLAQKNADKVGEFSLTDKKLSRITKFMAQTLFDENVGGPFGNTHIAVGSAYKDSIKGDPKDYTQEDFDNLGFNESVVHTDIVSTKDRVATATLADGREVVIYKDGEFTFEK